MENMINKIKLRTKKYMNRFFLFALALTVNSRLAFATETEEDLIDFLENIVDSLMRLGPLVMGIGLVILGLTMALGDENSARRGGLVFVGGILILSARGIVDLIVTAAGAF